MEQRTPVDCYRWGRDRLVDLVRDQDPDVPVRACPGWRVRDVVAHVTGVAADFLAGRLPTGDIGAWTEEQVAARRGVGLEAVLSEWDTVAPGFEAALTDRLAAGAPRFAADVVSHAFDVAAALGRPADRRGPAVETALDAFVVMLDGRLGSDAQMEIRSGGRVLRAGNGERSARLAAEPFEVLRALSGRRTEAEIRSLQWDGDVDAVITRISPFPLPDLPLGE